MTRLLIFTLVCSLVFIGLAVILLENRIEEELEKAILLGYPGTEEVDIQVEINWLKGGLKGNIANFEINIDNWRHGSLKINNFQGHFENIKINWLDLYRKKHLVVEKIEHGKILAALDENNLNKVLSRYYQGLTANLEQDRLKINCKISILGYDFTVTTHGRLMPGQGPAVYFVPEQLDIGNYHVPESIQQDLLKKLKIPLSLEKTPFTFQVTTVKIMQDKIIIEGKV